MSTESTLLQRCQQQCELCSADTALSVFDVPPDADGSADRAIMICGTCRHQINHPDSIEANHWRSLNDTMWSPVPAVQVMAWRQLKTLSEQGEVWAQALLDMLYLEADVKAWAESGVPPENEDREPTLDSNGTPLQAGDTVTIIKDLDVKGANFTAKRGTAVRNISLTDNPQHIEGRVNGQRIVLLSCYLKKS
ncbi:MAG: PhnA domain protein [Pseudomonadales bacterium]|jgi:protein PhnA|uniref:PhnA domain-containing protein n=1 Tax=unclassified Ketobacter TaxID=2639109 RepID=UPI000C368C6A|nr:MULTISPECIES: alkylphosphonate utilization protein [unclassified Ketobacter]MAA60950.1 PhnA domain protein [Pseudomonadales bacterium]TNC88652.1 MAG: PhnA domain protein [Alcanivorax sp.]HAG95059.1 PhnA domain protein [Gammaproteobacteria bacterium]MAQ23174.1 PhnA domain protein [Pseudomonadales bacterium]MBI27777.1 PhnA domain protein [Pseudomonadales bacterium]|tara:strand:- start:155 stop:733 length:579 start_codon:yes stop_codon:yes gene_type:complete